MTVEWESGVAELGADDWSARAAAATALREFVEIDAVREALVHALADDDTAVIGAAARSLVLSGGRRGLAEVLRALVESDEDVSHHFRDLLVDAWCEGYDLSQNCEEILRDTPDSSEGRGAREILSDISDEA